MNLDDRLGKIKLDKLQSQVEQTYKEIKDLVKDVETIKSDSLHNVALQHLEMKKIKHSKLQDDIEDLLDKEDVEDEDNEIIW